MIENISELFLDLDCNMSSKTTIIDKMKNQLDYIKGYGRADIDRLHKISKYISDFSYDITLDIIQFKYLGNDTVYSDIKVISEIFEKINPPTRDYYIIKYLSEIKNVNDLDLSVIADVVPLQFLLNKVNVSFKYYIIRLDIRLKALEKKKDDIQYFWKKISRNGSEKFVSKIEDSDLKFEELAEYIYDFPKVFQYFNLVFEMLLKSKKYTYEQKLFLTHICTKINPRSLISYYIRDNSLTNIYEMYGNLKHFLNSKYQKYINYTKLFNDLNSYDIKSNYDLEDLVPLVDNYRKDTYQSYLISQEIFKRSGDGYSYGGYHKEIFLSDPNISLERKKNIVLSQKYFSPKILNAIISAGLDHETLIRYFKRVSIYKLDKINGININITLYFTIYHPDSKTFNFKNFVLFYLAFLNIKSVFDTDCTVNEYFKQSSLLKQKKTVNTLMFLTIEEVLLNLSKRNISNKDWEYLHDIGIINRRWSNYKNYFGHEFRNISDKKLPSISHTPLNFYSYPTNCLVLDNRRNDNMLGMNLDEYINLSHEIYSEPPIWNLIVSSDMKKFPIKYFKSWDQNKLFIMLLNSLNKIDPKYISKDNQEYCLILLKDLVKDFYFSNDKAERHLFTSWNSTLRYVNTILTDEIILFYFQHYEKFKNVIDFKIIDSITNRYFRKPELLEKLIEFTEVEGHYLNKNKKTFLEDISQYQVMTPQFFVKYYNKLDKEKLKYNPQWFYNIYQYPIVPEKGQDNFWAWASNSEKINYLINLGYRVENVDGLDNEYVCVMIPKIKKKEIYSKKNANNMLINKKIKSLYLYEFYLNPNYPIHPIHSFEYGNKVFSFCSQYNCKFKPEIFTFGIHKYDTIDMQMFIKFPHISSMKIFHLPSIIGLNDSEVNLKSRLVPSIPDWDYLDLDLEINLDYETNCEEYDLPIHKEDDLY